MARMVGYRLAYRDRLGPSYDYLKNVENKSDEEIIESAARPSGADLGLLGW